MDKIEQLDWGMTRDNDYARSVASYVYEDDFVDCWKRFPARGSAHPDLGSSFRLETVNVRRVPTGRVLVTCNYKVDPGSNWTMGGGEQETEYSFDAACSMEPLLSHKAFEGLSDDEKDAINAVIAGTRPTEKTMIGGQEKTPVEVLTSELGKKALEKVRKGMESYYMPTVTYSVTSSVGSFSLSGVGKIDTPAGAPSAGAGKNWLLEGVSGRKKESETWRVTKTWRLSGSRGWDKDIYGN